MDVVVLPSLHIYSKLQMMQPLSRAAMIQTTHLERVCSLQIQNSQISHEFECFTLTGKKFFLFFLKLLKLNLFNLHSARLFLMVTIRGVDLNHMT